MVTVDHKSSQIIFLIMMLFAYKKFIRFLCFIITIGTLFSLTYKAILL